MKEKKTEQPKVRFKGFTDVWEQRKLGDYVEDYVEKTTVQNQYPVLTSSQQQGIVLQEDYFASRQVTTDNNIGYFVLPKGYLTYRSRSDNDVFVFNRNDIVDKGIISYFYPVFTIKNADSDFFLRRINNGIQRQISIAAEGTGQHVLSLKKFKNMKTMFPSIEEQIKIGEFFAQLDNLITLHQREYEIAQKFKKTMLSKMFPKNGADKPDLRFAGFTDAWEQCKLNQVADVYDGTHQTPDYKDEGVMFLSVENIKNLKSKKYISKEAFEKEFKIRPQKGDVLMTRIGDIGTANVVTDDGNIAYYVSLALFKLKMLDPYFLQSSIHSPFMQDQIWKRTLHIAFPKKINKNEIGAVPINIPNIEEQQKIGKFFKQLDQLITLHQRELDSLKNMKKTFLQQMFV